MNKRGEITVYHSAAAFVAAALAPATVNKDWRERHVGQFKSETFARWAGASSFRKAEALAQSGVNEHFTGSAKAAVQATLLDTMKRTTVFAVAGGAPSVPRVLACRPDCMRRSVVRRIVRPVVRIGFAIIPNAGISPEAFRARGLAVLGAIDAISRSGFPVELWATTACTDNASPLRVHGAAICLKAAGATLDWQRVAFWACHPAAARVLGFAWEDSTLSADARDSMGHGRGHAITRGPDMVNAFPEGMAFGALLAAPRSDEECFALTPDALAMTAIAAASTAASR